MSITRAERRAEAAKKRSRIDSACPPDLIRTVDVAIATTIAGRRISYRAGQTVAGVLSPLLPQAFAAADAEGFRLSLDLPDNTFERLARGLIAYSIKRKALN